MAVGEIWVADNERLALYVRPDELNLAFNFELVIAPWGAEAFHKAIDTSMSAMAGVGAPCTWVLGNHDVDRPATRYGGGPEGVARARAALLVQLSLPGAVYLYNGEELGLENVELPDEALQDPTWERSGHTQRGRDGERVPLPWSGDKPPYGFTTGPTTWLPMPDDWAGLTVEAEHGDPDSALTLFRDALAKRRELFAAADGIEWLDSPAGVLAYRSAGVTVVLNASDEPARLPQGEVLLASGPLPGDGTLPVNTAAWIG
jgi:alpha-glucosidase